MGYISPTPALTSMNLWNVGPGKNFPPGQMDRTGSWELCPELLFPKESSQGLPCCQFPVMERQGGRENPLLLSPSHCNFLCSAWRGTWKRCLSKLITSVLADMLRHLLSSSGLRGRVFKWWNNVIPQGGAQACSVSRLRTFPRRQQENKRAALQTVWHPKDEKAEGDQFENPSLAIITVRKGAVR